MDLELNWEHLKHYELLYDTCICREETQETIVPDACPDILRIVEAGGQLCLSEKSLQDGNLSVSGIINGGLLYQPEQGAQPCKIDFNLPVSVRMDAPDSTADSCCVVRPVLCRVDARTLNPRKVLVRAEVCVEVSVYQPQELSLCSGIEADTQAAVQQLKVEQTAYFTTSVREKAFSVYDEVHTPAGFDGAGELMCLCADTHCTEARMVGNKLLFKGETGVRLRYHDAGRMSSAVIPVSFSQVIELETAGEQADCTVCLYVTNMVCTKAGEDGRQLNITLDLVGQAVVAEKHTLTMLQDAYSTCGDMPVECQNEHVLDLVERYTKPQTVRELLETEVQPKRVVDAMVHVRSVTVTGPTVQVQLQADVMYVDDLDNLYSMSRTIQTSGQLEIPEGCNCNMRCSCPGEAFTTVTAGGIEVRFNLEFNGNFTRSIPVTTVKQVQWSQPNRECQQRQPSVVMRAALPGERLWDIAKAYRTTMQHICCANGFEQEELPENRMLLIPANR